MISKKFREAVKLDSRRQYELAWQAGINPTTLSHILIGYVRPRFGDPRVIKVGKLLGLKADDCFERSRATIGNDRGQVHDE